MPRLPRNVSGRRARRAFERAGWVYQRTAGDHMCLTKSGYRTLAIPDWTALPPFLLKGLLRTAGLDVEQFIQLLDE